jgi:competence ComEA-like helix-hairpin-helix protein
LKLKKREYETKENNETKEKILDFFFCFVIFFCFVFSLQRPIQQTAAASQQEAERININTATVEEFMRIPGIGPALAARMVEYRRKHGRFKRPQEIIIVRGMSAKRYRQIAHLIRI